MHPIVGHAGHRLRRHVRDVWRSRGGGFYGFVATVTFLYLEATALMGDVTGLPRFQVSISGVVGWLVQNLVTGIMNVVWASIWPVAWISRFGVNLRSAGLLGACYVLFLFLQPVILRLLREPGEVPGVKSP